MGSGSYSKMGSASMGPLGARYPAWKGTGAMISEPGFHVSGTVSFWWSKHAEP